MAKRKRAEELKKEVKTVMERQLEILMKDDRNMELIDNGIQILGSLKQLMELEHNDEETGTSEGLMKDVDETRDYVYRAEDSKEEVKKLLDRLPCSTRSGDTSVVKELELVTGESPSALALFGESDWPLPKLLNRGTIERSYSDGPLQGLLASMLVKIISHNGDASSRIVHELTDPALPFLVACLRSQSREARVSATDALNQLAFEHSNRKIIGESGAIKRLIELVKEGDLVLLPEASEALLSLCKSVVENRERAVSDGAVAALVGLIRSRVLVGEMLEILVVLSGDGKAVFVMEEEGMLPCLFKILTENVEEKCAEYCVGLIETMCVDDVTKINDVENGRRTLESVANIGTTMAKKKASDLLKRLDFESK